MNTTAVKMAVRQRDGNRCTECGLTAVENRQRHGRSLEVHRLRPGSPYTLVGSVTLCTECHKAKPKSRYGMTETVRLNLKLYRVLKAIAERNCSRVSDEAQHYIVRGLMAANLWPP